MTMNRVVIFVSNPFGFGPAGKAVAVMDELSQVWSGKIVYAASSMCRELIPEHLKSKIEIIDINERDETSLRELYSRYQNPLVICTLNRLAIKTAKSMGLHAFFIDSLAWMWSEIPEEYLLADRYYCFKLFDIYARLPDKKNIKVISPVFGLLPPIQKVREKLTILHVGGFKNPFQDKLSGSYLRLIAKCLNLLKISNKILVTGGSDAVSLVKSLVSSPRDIQFATPGRDEHLKLIGRASHFITTSGLTATLESFALRTPTSFLPPTNLSQWKILKLLTIAKCAESRVTWKDIFGKELDLDDMTEAQAVPLFSQMAQQAEDDPVSQEAFISFTCKMFGSEPNTLNQTKFIEKTGTNGSTTIVNDILAELS